MRSSGTVVRVTRHPVHDVVRQRPFILVVDDDDELRASICDELLAAGYVTRDTASGLEALEILENTKAGRAGLIIVDAIMPILGGAKFIERCALLPSAAGIPVIACSGDPIERLFMVASAHLHKPIRAEALLASVRAWFREA